MAWFFNLPNSLICQIFNNKKQFWQIDKIGPVTDYLGLSWKFAVK